MLHGLECVVNNASYEFNRKGTFQTLVGKTYGNQAVEDTYLRIIEACYIII